MLLAGVLEQVGAGVWLDKNMVIQKFPHHAQSFSSSRDHTRPARLSFVHAMILTMDARQFQENTSFKWNGGSSLEASKDNGAWELLTLRSLVHRNQWLTPCVVQWLAQLVTNRVLHRRL